MIVFNFFFNFLLWRLLFRLQWIYVERKFKSIFWCTIDFELTILFHSWFLKTCCHDSIFKTFQSRALLFIRIEFCWSIQIDLTYFALSKLLWTDRGCFYWWFSISPYLSFVRCLGIEFETLTNSWLKIDRIIVGCSNSRCWCVCEWTVFLTQCIRIFLLRGCVVK